MTKNTCYGSQFTDSVTFMVYSFIRLNINTDKMIENMTLAELIINTANASLNTQALKIN